MSDHMEAMGFSTNLLRKYMSNLNTFIEFSTKNIENVKTAGSFTRAEKLTFSDIAHLLLMPMNRGLQYELIDFYGFMQNGANDAALCPSKSAFCQARLKMKYEFFKNLSEWTAKENLKLLPDIKTYKGYSVYAADGSTLHLPCTRATRREFKVIKNQYGEQCVPRFSIVTDVLNKICISSNLGVANSSEKSLLIEQLDQIPAGSILLLDRLYAGTELMYLLQQRGINFVIRAKLSFNTEVKKCVAAAEEVERYVTQKLTERAVTELKKQIGGHITCKETISYRIIKIPIKSTGDTEILLTNLLDNSLTINDFGILYNFRWSIEGSIDVLKNKLAIEGFTGEKPDLIRQDFYATIAQYNISSFVRQVGDWIIKQGHKDSQDSPVNKQVNTSLCISLSSLYLKIAYKNPEKLDKLLEFILETLHRFPEPIRPNRRFNRKFKTHKARGRIRYDKNYKRTG